MTLIRFTTCGVGVAALVIPTGCRNGWNSDQIRSHLVSDFRETMSRSEVESKLRGYPLRGKTVESTWPTQAEWSSIHQAAYEPWALQETNHIGTDWTGPTVITATVRTPSNATFSTATLLGGLVGGGAPHVPHPYSVWFAFEDNALAQWGHSAMTTHYVYPQEQHK